MDLALQSHASEETAKALLPGSPDLSRLATDSGLTWKEFRPTLKARYGVVWLHIVGCYLMIALGLAIHALIATRAGNWIGLAFAPIAAVYLGFWVEALHCFVHEAAHYNVHPDKRTNDRIATFFLCPLVAGDMSSYRAVHWQHHLHLGTPEDTEVSYFNAPTAWFMVEAATGIHAMRVFRRRGRASCGLATSNSRLPGKGVLYGAVFHGIVLILALSSGGFTTALVWVMTMGFTYPFMNAIRQLLEHRSEQADPRVDYNTVPHGPVNRMFGTDFLSRTFGAGGFNRHLLHHWYPAASYTNFDELESFLLRTELAPVINSARTTYPATLRALMRSAKGLSGE